MSPSQRASVQPSVNIPMGFPLEYEGGRLETYGKQFPHPNGRQNFNQVEGSFLQGGQQQGEGKGKIWKAHDYSSN